jgi:hypothetical protein
VVEGLAEGIVAGVVEGDVHLFAEVCPAALLWAEMAEDCGEGLRSVCGEEGGRNRGEMVAEGWRDAEHCGLAGDHERQSERSPLLNGEDSSGAELADTEEGGGSVRGVVAFVHTGGQVAVVAICSGFKPGSNTTNIQRGGEVLDIEQRREVGGDVVAAAIIPEGGKGQWLMLRRGDHESTGRK